MSALVIDAAWGLNTKRVYIFILETKLPKENLQSNYFICACLFLQCMCIHLSLLDRFKNTKTETLSSPKQNIVPTGIMEELTDLFVAENKLSATMTDIKTLPAVSITKVTSAAWSSKTFATVWTVCSTCTDVFAFVFK